MASKSNPAFHSEQPDADVVGYRPVSRLAVAAFLFGVGSASALAAPLLWCVPLVGLALAIVALVQIDRAEVPMIGRKAAITGLILSILFGVMAPVHSATVNYWLLARAQRIAGDWFARIAAGETQSAFDLMIHGQAKHPPVPLAHGDQPAPVHTDLEAFAERQPVAQLLKMGALAKPKFLGGEVLPQEAEINTVSLVYQIPLEQTAAEKEIGAKQIKVQFNLQRRLEPGGERWLISSVLGSR